MNRDYAKEFIRNNYLKTYVEQITAKSKGGFYICPICGSGTGKNATGAFKVREKKWHCYSCGEEGDVFDLIGKIEGYSGFTEQFDKAVDIFGINADKYTDENAENSKTIIQTDRKFEQETDYTEFFEQANRNLENTDYRRGISLEVLNRFKVGYVERWKHPKVKSDKVPETPRLIIPTSKSSYLARDTRTNVPKSQKQYTKSKVGHTHIFNVKALARAEKPIFVVEGEIDALSIIEVGGEAVALGSVSMINSFCEILKTSKPAQPLIIALDNDKAGTEAGGKLEKELQAQRIKFFKFNPAGRYKDANEALINDREAFTRAVHKAENIETEAFEAEKEVYLATNTANYLQGFIDSISTDTPYIPTGFHNLDTLLDGGLYEGLYILGAISSLGKTTFSMQMADQIAQQGNNVLIFSLEMARNELISKSISRLTLLDVLENNGDIRNAKTARGITTKSRYAYYNQTEKTLIEQSVRAYSKYARNIYIHEGIGNIGADYIRDVVDRHIKYTGQKPVVIIDYLQILAPADPRQTDKQNTDKAVLELKRISRDYKIPVFAISSFNRDSYTESVSMKSFKESGAIEYSSDVLIGLQLAGAGEKCFDVAEAKKKNPREVELIILKNRNGLAHRGVILQYYPMFNYYKECGKNNDLRGETI